MARETVTLYEHNQRRLSRDCERQTAVSGLRRPKHQRATAKKPTRRVRRPREHTGALGELLAATVATLLAGVLIAVILEPIFA